MYKKWIIVLILFFVTMIGLALVDLWTFRLKPNGHMSGNGNPAILILLIFGPLYLVFIGFITYIANCIFKQSFINGRKNVSLLVSILLLGGTLLVLERFYFLQIFYSLGGFPDNQSSAIYRWGMWNQYTNTAYFNVITYTLGVMMAILIGYISAFLQRNLKR